MLSNATVNEPKGSMDGPSARLHDLRQRPDHAGRGLQQRHPRLSQRRAGPRRDIGRACSTRPRTTPQAALDRTASAASCSSSSSSPTPTSSRRWTASRRELPPLEASIPPSRARSTVLCDRTQTIRASVADVQFTLMLTIALVVMVIFLFLRNVWATLIPSVTVPLALVGTFAVMYSAGFSLDNLSLMALTIAVGFVVDDAIVMLENIFRHIEEGMPPMEAALKGAGEIGFTIVSISFSLIAVFIPLLLMGGIVGRLFREFAMTLSDRHRGLGLRLAHADADDVLALPSPPARSITAGSTGGARRLRRRCRLLRARRSTSRCDIRFITLLVFLDHAWRRPAVLFIVIPKGFFPQQDTGFLIGISEAGQDVSFAEWRAAARSWSTSSRATRRSTRIPRHRRGGGGQTE